MAWAKFDDRYDDHPKVRRAWRRHPRAVGVHVMAITYCARHETDGLVDAEWIADRLPVARERAAVLEALTEVGLFEPADDGAYQVHDFLDYNPSRAASQERRDRDSERKRRDRPRGIRTESAGSPDDASRARPRPVPSRPDPALPPLPPPEGNRQREQSAWKEHALAWASTAGVTGDPERLLRALNQAKPWTWTRNGAADDGDAADAFRAFVGQQFPRLALEAARPPLEPVPAPKAVDR